MKRRTAIRSESAMEEERKKAVRKAMNLLAYRDRSEKELTEKLKENGFSEDAAAAALDYVRSCGYVNDRRYAENYVYSMEKKKSSAALAAELRQRGVAEAFIQEALQNRQTEEDAAYALFRGKLGEPHRLEEKEKGRAFAFLQRRGFSQNVFFKCLRKYEAETADEE